MQAEKEKLIRDRMLMEQQQIKEQIELARRMHEELRRQQMEEDMEETRHRRR